MKTPMQEAKEYVLEMLKGDDVSMSMGTYGLIELKLNEMLEKEKEVMCEFGENVRGAMLKSDKHRTNEEVYNETFKTKRNENKLRTPENDRGS